MMGIINTILKETPIHEFFPLSLHASKSIRSTLKEDSSHMAKHHCDHTLHPSK